MVVQAGPVAERDTGAGRDSVARFVAENRIHSVEMGVPDSNGGLRGKRVPAATFVETMGRGVALSNALFVLDVAADLVEAGYTNFQTGFPDLRLAPDLSTLRLLPWRPGTAFVMCDCVDEGGALIEVAPRRILARVVESARELGYEPVIGPELEFYLLDPGTRAPATSRIPVYSLHEESRFEPVLADIRNQLGEAGVVLDASNAEYAPGQFEVNVRHCGALAAADATMLLRYAVKQIAAAHGLLATFMAKPFGEHSGSGLHVHQSLRSDERNLFAGGALSGVGRSYLAGLQRHMADLTALGAPTPNAYKRRTGYSFAPVNASWGMDNRTVGLRVPATGPDSARVEQRDAAADANPYLVIAGQLAAGLDGIQRDEEPEAITDGNAYEAAGAQPLPATLPAAIELLERSELARSVCGDAFLEIFLALARRELELYDGAVTDWERERYLETS